MPDNNLRDRLPASHKRPFEFELHATVDRTGPHEEWEAWVPAIPDLPRFFGGSYDEVAEQAQVAAARFFAQTWDDLLRNGERTPARYLIRLLCGPIASFAREGD